MVCRLIEGWEQSTAMADYAGKWTSVAGASGSGISSSNGRNGNGFRCTGTSGGGNANRVFDLQPTWVVGFAYRISSIPAGAFTILTFLEGATAHCGVAVDATGALFAWRATNATNIGTSTGLLTANAWNYIEVKATIHDTAGVFVIRLNGAVVLNLSTADTRNGGSAGANSLTFRGGGTGSPSSDFDDMYIFDTTGSTNTDFAGDCKVSLLLPSGAGATTAWTPSAGSNYQCVDDPDANEDTDYVSSATAAQTDTYAYADLSVTGTVKAVQATAQARTDDAGSRSIALIARPGSTDRAGTTQALGTSYALYPQVWDTNPDTSAAWSVSELNASQFGTKLVA